MQVRYVNKALQRFDSTQVIPIQFVVFTLCVIVGSAVLYRDFERTTAERAVKFVGGCFLTFFGVFLITSGRPPSEGDDEEMLSDDEDIEETLRLAEQDPNAPQSPTRPRYRDNEESSRRSSKVSFMDAVNKPLAVLDTGVPTPRSQPGATSRTSFFSAADAIESAPLLRTPSRDGPVPPHPGVSHTMSSESAVTLSSATPIYSEPATHPGTPSQEPPTLVIPDENNATPRPHGLRPRASQRFSSHLFSPSPFDSTVRGLVPSTFLSDSPRPASRRRLSRPSLRASLYVPQDELEEDEEEAGIMSAIERSRTYEESPIEGPKKKGFRTRAKSLTNTVTDLFGVNRKHASQTGGFEDDEGGRSSQTNHSTETL